VAFEVEADAYSAFMGRYSEPLADVFVQWAGVGPGRRALDVGCGPGALTEHLAGRVGAEQVAAIDPSELFVQACAARVPGADVRAAGGERLPWEDDAFDAVLSQLAVNFMADPPQGVSEMRRVAKPSGVVAACVWDHERMEMLRTFWDSALVLDPDAPTEAKRMRFGTPDELRELWTEAGLERVVTDSLEVTEEYESFDDYWEPFTAGVGPGGSYCVSLDDDARQALRGECRRRLGDPPGAFALRARAWAVRGT
jgi:ubiquinone/menaquinone biosynthesis C-methylase UbiE